MLLYDYLSENDFFILKKLKELNFDLEFNDLYVSNDVLSCLLQEIFEDLNLTYDEKEILERPKRYYRLLKQHILNDKNMTNEQKIRLYELL